MLCRVKRGMFEGMELDVDVRHAEMTSTVKGNALLFVEQGTVPCNALEVLPQTKVEDLDFLIDLERGILKRKKLLFFSPDISKSFDLWDEFELYYFFQGEDFFSAYTSQKKRVKGMREILASFVLQVAKDNNIPVYMVTCSEKNHYSFKVTLEKEDGTREYHCISLVDAIIHFNSN